MDAKQGYLIGRGAQLNPHNPFDRLRYVAEHLESIDEPDELSNPKTEYIIQYPKAVVNKVDSPDVGMVYSLNPYQGCEHGCVYCYARNTHNYWGYSAGVEFESKIIVKPNAAELLERFLRRKSYSPEAIVFSGNTDCYQPVERKLEITRRLLQVCVNFRNPVGIITKNALITRDLDLLGELAADRLVQTHISITTLDMELHKRMEPRTAPPAKRLRTVRALARAGIPVNVMVAPIIPGLNDHEIPAILKASAEAGATSAGFTMVRLNGAVGQIFSDWLNKNYPDKKDKVLNAISGAHGGQLNDSRFGTRMRGEGKVAEMIRDVFYLNRRKHLGERPEFRYNKDLFRVPSSRGQMQLF